MLNKSTQDAKLQFVRRFPEYAVQFDDHQLDSDVTNHVFDAEKTRLRGHIHRLNY
ncbi:hypothetical protein D3C71_2150210 [compost metagenome]